MCEIATKEEQKTKAIEFMKTLDIYKPYVQGFEKNDSVCFFERFGGYWVDQEPEIYEKMKEIEKEHELTVYAITHENAEFGECWSFLYVSKYKEDWEYTVSQCGNNAYYAAAYVWNKTEEFFSEFGDIVVKCFGGGLCRIG